jgi:hypothetical protein
LVSIIFAPKHSGSKKRYDGRFVSIFSLAVGSEIEVEKMWYFARF